MDGCTIDGQTTLYHNTRCGGKVGGIKRVKSLRNCGYYLGGALQEN